MLQTREIQFINKDEEMPRLTHTWLIANLIELIGPYLKKTKYGRISYDLDIYFPHSSRKLRPDLSIISFEKLANQDMDGSFYGVPDWIIEVVSPMSLIEDGSVKRQFYAQEGVPEYWIVFPETRTINAYSLKDGRYELSDVRAEKGILIPVLFPELNMDLSQIFDF